jgi:hypothetical protein
VPAPDSGIPRETVEGARHIVSNNKPCSSNGDRLWELSGGVLRCSECGRRMRTSVTRKKDGKRYFYYSCARRQEGSLSSWPNRKTHRAERIEPARWNLLPVLLTDPERLYAGLEEMMDRERSGVRVAPDREVKAWLERLAEADRMRAGYQELEERRLCTAEGRGSNPFGSTHKRIDLQVKREGSVEAPNKLRGLVLQLILQRVNQGAVCPVQQGALLTREQRRRYGRAARRGTRGSV